MCLQKWLGTIRWTKLTAHNWDYTLWAVLRLEENEGSSSSTIHGRSPRAPSFTINNVGFPRWEKSRTKHCYLYLGLKKFMFVSFVKEPVCFFVPDKMKVAPPKPRTALRRCPAPGSEMTQQRLSNAWAAEKTMPTEHWTTPELLTGRIQKRCNSWVKGLTKVWCLHAHVNWTALGRKKRL